MNSEKIGQFIAELRKEKQLTQKELALQVGVTDKAVSKWERGLSCPDIALLAPLSEILEVSVMELLNGERSDTAIEDIHESIENAITYTEKSVKNRWKSWQSISTLAFSMLLGLGLVICAICDVAITGTWSWSLYPISAIIFTWLVFFPVLKWGKKGITGTMISLSVLIIPFLYILDMLVENNDMIVFIGSRMAVISLAYIWGVYFIFQKTKGRIWLGFAFACLLAIPADILINVSLAKIISLPIMSKGDIFEVVLLSIFVVGFWVIDYYERRVSK